MRHLSLRCVGVILVASGLLSGCARAYHAYQNGCVTYGYRAQQPPAFTFYRGCPTPWLSRHSTPLQTDAKASKAPDRASLHRQSSQQASL